MSIGGIAIGLMPWGGLAVGLFAIGGFALGGVEHAAQANNEIATQFINGRVFFQRMVILSHYIGWLNLRWLLPLFGWWKVWTKQPNRPTLGPASINHRNVP